MKFTCDNCSAQYMIADEKIGARGVKVRCKKCSHVIVLKRASVPAPASDAQDTASPFSLAPEPQSATASAFELPRTSSDMGLSAEFSAAGFEDTQSAVARPSQTNLRDELIGSGDGPWGEDPPPIAAPARPSASPFGASGAGGSLADFTDEAPNTELSAFPEFGSAGLRQDLRDRDEDPAETTKVDGGAEAAVNPFGLAAPRADSAGDAPEPETRVAPVDIPPEAIPGFGDDPTAEGSEAEVRASTSEPSLPAFDFGRSLASALGEADAAEDPFAALAPKGEAPPSEAPRSSDAPRAGELGSSPAPWSPPSLSALASETESGPELGSALGEALGGGPGGWTPEDGLGDLDVGDFDLGRKSAAKAPSAPAPKPPSLSPEEAPVVHQESTAVGVTMAEAEGREQAALIASHMAGLSKEHLDAELGSALDAVFGDESEANPQPSSTGPDPFASLVASAKGALVSTGIAPEEDRKETRVFDNEAMLRVQEEQHRAFGAGGAEPEPVKEWYIGIDDEQVGPISVAELEAHWDEARIDANALCWRQGMGDWTAVRFVEELAHLLERPQSKRPKPSDRPLPVAAERAEPVAARTFSALGGAGMAAQGGSADAGDMSDWRPSAASALASLAAAELDAPKANDIQVGPVLPVKKGASGSFESLIQPPTRSASLFGVQEETSPSMASAVTRAPELVSPVPIAPVRTRSSVPPWLPPTVAVLIGFVLLGGVLIWKLSPGSSTSAPSAAERPAEVAQAGLNPTGAAAPVAPEPAAAAAPTAPSPEPAPAAAAGGPTEAAPPPTPTTELLAAAAPSEPEDREDEGSSRAEKKKSKRESTSAKRKSRREREVEEAPPPPPPPPPTRARSTADDLLESAGSSRRSAPEAPSRDTLDEADIFRVLKNNRSAILSCVDAQRKADPSVEGVMTVKFVIQGSGKTSGHSVEPSKFGGTKVGKCVISAVKKWSFPSFSGRAIPLDFPVKVTGG